MSGGKTVQHRPQGGGSPGLHKPPEKAIDSINPKKKTIDRGAARKVGETLRTRSEAELGA